MCAQRKKQARMVRRERYWLFHLHAVAKEAGAVLASQEIVPVEVEVPERFSRWNTGSAAAKAGAAIYEEGIEICTGNISIRLPKNTSADYLASLVKGLN